MGLGIRRGFGLAMVLVLVTSLYAWQAQAASAVRAGRSGATATSSDPAVAFQVDPAHSGGQPSDSLVTPVALQWNLDLQGPVSYPLIANGRAFVTVNGGTGGGPRMYALDLQTGTALWGPIDLGSSAATAAYENGKIFTVNSNGMMQALDAATGHTLWFTALSGQYAFSSAPTALNGIVYTSGAGGGGTVYAVNEADGTVRWTAGVINGDNSSPVVTSTGVYVGYPGHTYDFNPSTGAVIWHDSNGGSGGGGNTAVLSGTRLYVRDTYGTGNHVYDAATGLSAGAGSFTASAPPAFDNTQGYYLSTHTLQAEDANQVIKWSFSGDGLLDTSPVVANGTIYEGSSSGNLYALDTSGNLKQTINVGAGISAFSDAIGMLSYSAMAIGDGTLLVPAGTHLVAFSNATPGAGPSPTPTPSASLQPPTGGVSQQVTVQVDAGHTGFQAADSTTPPLGKAWTRDFTAAASYPLIADGRVYVAAGTQLHAMNAQTGIDDWAVDLGATSFIAYADSRIFAVSSTGLLKSISSISGAPYWSTQLPFQWSFSSPPTVSGGIVYTGGAGSGGTVYAVDQWNGNVIWKNGVQNGDNSSPAVSSTGVYVSYACRQTYDFDPKGGGLLWHNPGPCEGGGGATPALYRGHLYLLDGFAGNMVVDASTGMPIRSFASRTTPAFDGSLAFLLNGSTLVAEDVSSGAIRWAFAGDGGLATAPIAVNGYVYIGSSTGTLYAVSALTGQSVWSDPTGVAYGSGNVVSGLGAGEGLLVGVAGTRVVGYGAHISPVPTATPIPPTPPGAPTSVQAVPGFGAAQVSWTAPASSGTYPITSYNVTPHAGATTLAATTVSGSPPATTVVINGLTNGTFYTFTVTATSKAGTGPPSAPSNAVRPMLGGSYHPLAPSRILDTRNGVGSPIAPLVSNTSRSVVVAGQGGVPPTGTASAVVLNVTVTNATGAGFLTVYPTGATRPNASNLNWVAGQTVPNLVEVALGDRGQVDIFGYGSSEDVIFDVQGWVGTASNSDGPTGLYNALAPARILDTRDGTGNAGTVRPLGPNATLTLQVTGSLIHNGSASGVPASGVSSVILNVTVTNPTAAGYLTVYPADVSTRPNASNLNFAAGKTVANRVMVRLSTGTGQIKIFNPAGNVDVIADVNGWFTDATSTAGGTSFGGTVPQRFFDTRAPGAGGPLPGGYVLSLQVLDQNNQPATGVTAMVFNVTATNATAPSYLTLWPDPGFQGPPPNASDVNFTAGQTVPNLVVVQLGANSSFDIYNAAGSTDIILDLVGVYGTRNAATATNTLRMRSASPRYRFSFQPAPAPRRGSQY